MSLEFPSELPARKQDQCFILQRDESTRAMVPMNAARPSDQLEVPVQIALDCELLASKIGAAPRLRAPRHHPVML